MGKFQAGNSLELGSQRFPPGIPREKWEKQQQENWSSQGIFSFIHQNFSTSQKTISQEFRSQRIPGQSRLFPGQSHSYPGNSRTWDNPIAIPGQSHSHPGNSRPPGFPGSPGGIRGNPGIPAVTGRGKPEQVRWDRAGERGQVRLPR